MIKRVVGVTVNFKNKTFWIVMSAKSRLHSKFGSLNPNLALVIAHHLNIHSIVIFSASGNNEIGNTVTKNYTEYKEYY